MLTNYIILSIIFWTTIDITEGIWCYRCTSSTPGCGEKFNWRGIGYLGDPCPENDDICVKIIEKKDDQKFITRQCLSSLYFRTDIPADRYEGCRPAAKDIRLANYVNNSIKELDVKRDYYDQTTFCFCFLDHRCNNGENLKSNIILALLLAIASIFFMNN